MTGLEFIASIVASLAWPGMIVALVVLLRRPLVALVPSLRKLKYKEFEIEFARELEGLKEDAAALPALPPAPATPSTEEDAVLRLAAVSPRAAVVEAWRLVEVAAREALGNRPVAVASSRPPNALQLTRSLLQSELLDEGSRGFLDRLRMLRNQAVHADDFDIDEASAREYAVLALQVVRRLKPPVLPQ